MIASFAKVPLMKYWLSLTVECRSDFVVHSFQLCCRFSLKRVDSAKMLLLMFLSVFLRFYQDLHLLK